MKNRSTKQISHCVLLCLLVLMASCATSPEKSKQSVLSSSYKAQENEKDPFSNLSEQYRLKAREAEKGGDLPKALKNWEIVKNLIPGDEEAGGKTAQLKMQISAYADQHFHRGLAYFQNRNYPLARNEFLHAIYLKPDYEEAINYLKQKMAGEEAYIYEVKKGDTIKGIALKFYKDAKKDFLIAYFNGLRPEAQIEPPLILRMPVLELPQPKKPSFTPPKKTNAISVQTAKDIQEVLGKAKNAYQAKNYPESAALAEKLMEYNPENRESRELLNASYYQLGKQLAQAKKVPEALEAFKRVEPGYKDVNLQLAQSQKKLAEVHYIKGVKSFNEEELETAIVEWEATLALDPKHPTVKKDIENARNLLQKLEKVK